MKWEWIKVLITIDTRRIKMSDSTVLCVNTFAAFIGVIPFMIILQIVFRKHKLPKRHQFGLYLYVLVICSILMSYISWIFSLPLILFPLKGLRIVPAIISRVLLFIFLSACCFQPFGNSSSRCGKPSLIFYCFLF